jgi:hypothetical protein
LSADVAEEIADWLRDRLDIAVENGPELRLRECLFCGRARTMKVNVERRKFLCFHQDCAEAGGLLKLIEAVEGCTSEEARGIMASLVRGLARGHSSIRSLSERARQLREQEEPEPVRDLLAHDLPEGFEPCWTGSKFRIPRYLKERDAPRDELRRFGVGWYTDDRETGRIVIPVLCDGARSWVARKIDPDDFGPKYLTPHSAGDPGADRLLFAYDEIPDEAETVVAVEGTFDAMRLWSYGFYSVAYLKDRIGPGQIAILGKKRPRRLVLFPDGGDARAKEKALRDGAVLAGRFEEVAVALLELRPGEKKTDPDSAPRALVEQAIRVAQPVTRGSAQEFARSRLRSPWGN